MQRLGASEASVQITLQHTGKVITVQSPVTFFKTVGKAGGRGEEGGKREGGPQEKQTDRRAIRWKTDDVNQFPHPEYHLPSVHTPPQTTGLLPKQPGGKPG